MYLFPIWIELACWFISSHQEHSGVGYFSSFQSYLSVDSCFIYGDMVGE